MRLRLAAILIAAPLFASTSFVVACSSTDAPGVVAPSSELDAGDTTPSPTSDDDDDTSKDPTNKTPIIKLVDGGTQEITVEDGGTPPEGIPPYATRVVSFSPGKCAGFGAGKMPNVVLGPPIGGGHNQGSTDVVSLGTGGEIVLSFEPNVVVDGPGVDLIVFENAFFAAGATKPFAEIGEVSVSEDGQTWTTFPCTATAYPWGACAGWHETSKEDSSSLDPAKTGGDPYDLADIGVTRVQYVRIVDKGDQSCNPAMNPKTNGFDLDAIAGVHVE